MRLPGAEDKPKDATAAQLRDAIAPMIALVYGIPAANGYGQHWALADEEAKALAGSAVACVGALPAKTKQRWMRGANKVLPWAGLAMTAYAITMPRVMITQMMQAQTKAPAVPAPPPRSNGAAQPASVDVDALLTGGIV